MGCVGRGAGPGTSNGFPLGCPPSWAGPGPNKASSSSAVVPGQALRPWLCQNALSASLPCENAERLQNSVSTLLNRGGIACRRSTASQDLCASAKQTQTLTATLLHPCTSGHERKRGSAGTAAAKLQIHFSLLSFSAGTVQHNVLPHFGAQTLQQNRAAVSLRKLQLCKVAQLCFRL